MVEGDLSKRIAGSLLALALPACAALREGPPELSRDGTYLQAGASLAIEEFTAFEDQSHDADEQSPGFNLRAGRRLHPHVAVELSLQTYAGIDAEFANPALDGDVSGVFATLNLKHFLTTGALQPYVLAGAGYGDTDNGTGVGGDGGGAVGVLGVGADCHLSREWALYLDLSYYRPFGDADEFSVFPITFGVRYGF